MVYDTNVVLAHVCRYELLPIRAVLPIVVVGELKALALKGNWGYQRVAFLERLFGKYPLVAVDEDSTDLYARVDAYC